LSQLWQQRGPAEEALAALREHREALLGALPVELRREWARRLGLAGPEG